jgi:ABC-type maltose transport system permease subunit
MMISDLLRTGSPRRVLWMRSSSRNRSLNSTILGAWKRFVSRQAATVIVIGFIGSWSNFLGPLVFLNTAEKFPIALGIQWFRGVAGNIGAFGQPTEQLMMAAAFVATLVPLILFMSAQRFFVEGIVTTGFKGAA